MQKSLWKCFAAMALLAASASPALAQHKACLLESRFSMGGITTDIRDCIQANNAAAQSGLKRSCEGLPLGSPLSPLSYFGAPADLRWARPTYCVVTPESPIGSAAAVQGIHEEALGHLPSPLV